MKNSIGLYPIALDIPQNRSIMYYLVSAYKKVLRIALITFVAFFSFIGMAVAQTKPLDLGIVYKDNPNKTREMKREVRAEKQSTRAVESISTETMDRFKEDFPKAQNVAWSVPADQFIEASFLDKKNKPMMAFYSFENQLLGTGHYTNYDAIPAKAQQKIAKDYKGYTPVSVMWVDMNESSDESLDLFELPIESDGYFVQLKNGEKQIIVQVDTDGEILFFNEVK